MYNLAHVHFFIKVKEQRKKKEQARRCIHFTSSCNINMGTTEWLLNPS